MGKQLRPDYSFDEKTNLYRKKIKDETGKYVPVYGHSVKELREKYRARAAQIEEAKRALDCPYVYQYSKIWFDSWVPGRKHSDTESIRNAINNHILPKIGNMLMIDVTEDDLEDMLAESADMSRALNDKICRATKSIFKSAFRSGIIASDPSSELSARGTPTKEKQALTREQQMTLQASVEGHPIELFVDLVLSTGLRREEALGLQWDCVHLTDTHPSIDVRRALHWEHNQPVVSDDLKSKAARRTIPIPPELVGQLQAEKDRSSGKYVFGGSKAWSSVAFKNRWSLINALTVGAKSTRTDIDGNKYTVERQLLEKVTHRQLWVTIDFHVTPHILRHTYITNLILGGVNIKTVQYLAGHSNVKITLDIYTHLMGNRPEDIAKDVLAALPKV